MTLLVLVGLRSTPALADAGTSFRFSKTFDATNGIALGIHTKADSSGNIYVTGQFSGTIVFDGVGGNDSITSPNNTLFITKYDNHYNYLWTRTFDSSANGSFSVPYSMAIANDSEIILTGYFGGTVNFAGSQGNDTDVSSLNQTGFISSFKTDGTYNWTRTQSGAVNGGLVYSYGVAVNSKSEIAIVGDYIGTINFAGANGSDIRTSGSYNTFFSIYSLDGTYKYTKVFGSNIGSDNYGREIDYDSKNNIVITGNFNGQIITDQADSNHSFFMQNTTSYIAKYDSNGNYIWSRVLDTSAAGSNAQTSGVVVGSNGTVYVTGTFGGVVNFAGGTGTNNINADSTANVFLTKYSSTGDYVGTKAFDTVSPNPGQSYVFGIATDPLGDIYIAGYFAGIINFAGASGTDTSDGGLTTNAFVAKYNSDFSYAWTRRYIAEGTPPIAGSFLKLYMAGPAVGVGIGVCSDTQGNIYVVGMMSGLNTLADSVSPITIDANGSSINMFLASFSAYTPVITPPVTPGLPDSGNNNKNLTSIVLFIISSFGIAVLLLRKNLIRLKNIN